MSANAIDEKASILVRCDAFTASVTSFWAASFHAKRRLIIANSTH
jgi:hypothetical protein